MAGLLHARILCDDSPNAGTAGLVVNHRYLIDAIVDQKRYRYSGPVWLLKMIWAVAP